MENLLPKVVIDARMIGKIPHGIARYVLGIAKGLRQLHADSPLPYEITFLTQLPLTDSLLENFSPFQTLPTPVPFLSSKELFFIPKILKQLEAHLYHSPSFSSLWSCPCDHLITVHDLNHLTYGNFIQKQYYRLLLKRFCRTAKKVLTVSQFSQQEIAKWLQWDPLRIQITPNAIELTTQKPLPFFQEEKTINTEILSRRGLKTKKYFLCISNEKPHKNLKMLVKAYHQFFKNNPPINPSAFWPLAITTSNLFTKQPLSGILELGQTSEKEIQILLQNAAGLFFPSLYEGFGLPPLEGAVLGTPLVVSDIPAHRETLATLSENEIFWANPYDTKEWEIAFQNIVSRQIQPTSLLTKQALLEQYSVEKLGRKIDQIYRNMLNKPL